MPEGTREIHYQRRPGFAGIYGRLLLGQRRSYKKGMQLPAMRAIWKGARAEPADIEKYCEACGMTYDGHYPLLYPHVLTSAIHIDLISQPEFPLSPMGAVHTRIHVLQHAPIPADAVVNIECVLGDSRILKQGLEFEITTTLSRDGVVCWESISANLIRGKKFGEPEEPAPLAQLPPLENETATHTWEVPKNMGWRYARITGDFNPIHVSGVLARVMGFNRDLIHGMWSAARCLGHLPDRETERPVRVDLLFKGPVYMESTATMKLAAGDTRHAFDLYCSGNDRPVVRGQVEHADAGTVLVPRPDA